MNFSIEVIMAIVTILTLWNSLSQYFVRKEIRVLQLQTEKSSLELEQKLLKERHEDLMMLTNSRHEEIEAFKKWIEDHYAGYRELEELVKKVEAIEKRLNLCNTCPR